MIKLEVENYCHDCDSFKPVADLPTVLYGGDGSETIIGHTIVSCRDRLRCKRLMKHLEEKNES